MKSFSLPRTATLFVLLAFACAGGATEPAALRVMTYNIHHGRGNDNQIDLRRIADVIRKVDPDVVALQEVDVRTRRSSGVDQMAEIAKLTGMHGHFAKGRDYEGGEYGQALLSRWPMQQFEVHPLPPANEEDKRIGMSAQVTPPNPLPPFLAVGTHLHHIREPLRVQQFTALLQVVDAKAAGSSAVLMGDFNSEPTSGTMQFAYQGWDDTLTSSAKTYPSDTPRLKIDHILVPKAGGWKVRRAWVVEEKAASDHRPVVAELEWAPNQ